MAKTKVPLSKGEKVILEIEGLNHDGEGVGRFHGFTVFVPWTAPGDRVEAEIISFQKNYARALPLSLPHPSPYRQEAPSPYHGRCGGCQLQHLQYSEQLRRKRQLVADALQRLGGIDVPVRPVMGMEEPWHYRNKAQYPVVQEGGKPKIGFFQRRSHNLVDVRHCLIQHPAAERVVAVVRELITELNIPVYNEKEHRGLLRHLITRTSFSSGEVLLVLVTNGRELPALDQLVAQLTNRVKDLVGIVQNINTRRGNVITGEENLLLWGRDYVVEELGALRFQISAGSFFQINSRQAKVLFNLVRDYAELKGGETVFDLYCGSGAISLFLSGKAARVIGVESYTPAVEDARKNARLNGITNVEFHAGLAEEVMTALSAQCLRADVAVMDPPRKGCEEKLLAALAEMQPSRIVYVSCNPATLARDLRYLAGAGPGYHPVAVQPIDMFPHTAHVECIVLIKRVESRMK
ncbi:MAG: 23S rRNA (uracil(1939)-C(5))-methyltransferase RlmD [Bacillota bacterium]